MSSDAPDGLRSRPNVRGRSRCNIYDAGVPGFIALVRPEFRSETHVIQIRIAPDTAVHRFRMRTGHPAVDLTEARVREFAGGLPYSWAEYVLDGETPVADLVQQAACFRFYDEAKSNDGVTRRQRSRHIFIRSLISCSR